MPNWTVINHPIQPFTKTDRMNYPGSIMINILHLSDLHFGYDTDKTAIAQRATALRLLCDELKKLDKAWKPDIIVISGDLSWQGRPSGYTELAAWLTTKLFPATALSAQDCIICPGNHDLDREEALTLPDRERNPQRADILLRPENLARGMARPFQAFVDAATKLGVPAPKLHNEDNYLAGVREHKGLHFICLNSAWFCRDSATDRTSLWLGLPQLESMSLLSSKDYDTAPLAVAVLHHPENWFTDHECNSYGNRAHTYAYLAERSHLILSGHTHGAIERATRCYDRARLFLGGAAYDSHAYRNNFSILQLDLAKRHVTRRPWEYQPQKPEWEEKKRQTYSLLTEPPVRGQGNPEKYLAWLRSQTQLINLHQLSLEPGKTPPASIDSLYAPLMTTFRPMRAESEDLTPDGMRSATPVPLEDALQIRRLVIEGKPGSGKSTFVRWIVWNLCRPGGAAPGFPLQGFPLFIRISELDEHITITLRTPTPGDPKLDNDSRWVAHFLAAKGWDLNEDFFAGKLAEEDTLLLLDGLDEAADQTRRERVVQMVTPAASQWNCRVVVTTRPGAHEGRATLVGFDKVSIEDLDDPGIERFLQQWCHWLKLGDEGEAQTYYNQLRPAVAVASIHILARNPLMLTILAVLHLRRHKLPEQRAQLYEQIIDWLADQAVEKHRGKWRKDQILDPLSKLALMMQTGQGGLRTQIGIDDAARLIADGEPTAPVRSFLEQAQVDCGIITLRGKEIVYWHLSFQEYLAARELAGLPDAELTASAARLLYLPEGREVLPLLAGYMALPSRRRLDAVFEALTDDGAAQPQLERQAHATGVLGRMLSDLTPFDYRLTPPAEARYLRLRQVTMSIFEKGKSRHLGLKTRVAAAEALDQADQSRHRTPDQPDYWISIPKGTLTTGDSGAYQALPKDRHEIAAFRIARFPVTVWEYGKFLADTGTQPPNKWEEQSLHPSRPVVRVDWEQARAYCEWASRKWNMKCKLPNDLQWEFAARGPGGRTYPWGPENQQPDEHRANFNSMVGEPTPVGMFPDGETPEGVSDMAGNVWEWTSSNYQENKPWKVVRGASFYVEADYLRAAVRDRGVPVNSYYNLGFRCVRE